MKGLLLLLLLLDGNKKSSRKIKKRGGEERERGEGEERKSMSVQFPVLGDAVEGEAVGNRR